jgi:peptidoglycan/xylan/chitin deacetylase (PgdA/CDA1 family)
MRIPGLKHVRAVRRWLTSRFVDGALILGYHRIADSPADPFSLCVTPDHFGEQLDLVRKFARPITLRALVLAAQEGKVPRRAVALTFDDGYSDNLHFAKPLLERYEVPATVFVATGFAGKEFWWDRLDRLLPDALTLPNQLAVRIKGTTHRFETKKRAGGGFDEFARARRQDAVTWLHRLLQPLPERERRQVMRQVRAWGRTTCRDDPSRRGLSPNQMLRLVEGNLVEIGAHSVSHPVLGNLPISRQKAEILQSKTYLEELLNRPVMSFSYPHGSSSTTTAALVREAGYACACTSFNGIVWSRSDSFQLPRFWVSNLGGALFSRWLCRWLRI